ncbi:Poly-beta-1,6-N-acetyl-D-glucosamine N-deacetylase [bioreactor metagenome]|uniref:Poly-beta-1,6-N-acetyl-D-glucosamine N-deacetylase n=1 Tax=bioreactor metagenome TaxID=1076179 RepID=A0A645DBA7_9ZZZZ
MRYLYEQGYTTLTLQQVKDLYYSDKPLPKKAVLLTFDDLFKSVYIYAYPILKKYNFHAVGFVVKNWLFSETQEYRVDKSVTMSFQEVEKISDVFEFANHTASLHKRSKECTEVQVVDKEILYKDLMECEAFVNTKGVFAYPFGGYNEQVIENLKQLGYLLGFTTEEGKNTIATDTMKLYRYGVFINYDINKFMDIFQ